MLEYPSRPKFFANQVIRLLGKTCAANNLGIPCAWLITQIVMTEDASHYRRAVTFYDGQLMPIVGVNSQKSLALARQKAVDAGWLCYEPGFKGKAGSYYVTIPQSALNLDDAPMDEEEDSRQIRGECDVNFTSKKGTNLRGIGDESTSQRETNLQGKGQTILPVPDPVPNPTPKEDETHGGVWLEGQSPEFKTWWQTYPRRQKQNLALASWRKAIRQVVDDEELNETSAIEFLLAATREYAQSPAGREPVGQKDVRPLPSNWLDAGSWKDDRKTWQLANGFVPSAREPTKPVFKPLPKDDLGDNLMELMK